MAPVTHKVQRNSTHHRFTLPGGKGSQTSLDLNQKDLENDSESIQPVKLGFTAAAMTGHDPMNYLQNTVHMDSRHSARKIMLNLFFEIWDNCWEDVSCTTAWGRWRVASAITLTHSIFASCPSAYLWYIQSIWFSYTLNGSFSFSFAYKNGHRARS